MASDEEGKGVKVNGYTRSGSPSLVTACVGLSVDNSRRNSWRERKVGEVTAREEDYGLMLQQPRWREREQSGGRLVFHFLVNVCCFVLLAFVICCSLLLQLLPALV